MPPIFALFVSVLFILWLFRMDIKERGAMPFCLWIPFIWILIKGTRGSVAAWLWLSGGGGGGSELDGNPLDATIALMLFFAAYFVLSKRRIGAGVIPKINLPLFFLLALFLCSILWAPYSFVAFKRWTKEFGAVLIALIIVTDKNPGDALKMIIIRLSFICLPLSLVFIKYYPHIGRSFSVSGSPMVTGVTMQKNSLGQLACICCLVLIWDLVDRSRLAAAAGNKGMRIHKLFLIGLGLWLLVESQSKTSFLALLVGAGIFLSTHLRVMQRISTIFAKVTFATIAIALCMLPVWTAFFAPLLNAVGRDATFTERTAIWEVVLDQPFNRLIGSGFHSFWLEWGPNVWAQFYRAQYRTAHSGYLETLLDNGWIGIAVLVLFLVFTSLKLTEKFYHTDTYHKFLFAWFMILLIVNFSESVFFRLGLVWFIGVVAALSIGESRAEAEQTAVPSINTSGDFDGSSYGEASVS